MILLLEWRIYRRTNNFQVDVSVRFRRILHETGPLSDMKRTKIGKYSSEKEFFIRPRKRLVSCLHWQ